MRNLSNSGGEATPRLEKASGNAPCPGCGKKIPKGQICIEIALNTGPTGKKFFCLKHAKILADEILVLVKPD